jgi:hypothetical protein
LEAEEVQLQEKEALLQDVKVLVADLEGQSSAPREGGFGQSSSAPRREGGFTSDRPRTEGSSDSTKTFRKLW